MNNQHQRSGKWTDAEQIYANALIEGFRSGQLDIQEGTSLRKLLATKLFCNVKRVSKKYEGTDYQGKNLYARDQSVAPEVIEAKKEQLERLERAFYNSIDVRVDGQSHQIGAATTRSRSGSESVGGGVGAGFLAMQTDQSSVSAAASNFGGGLGRRHLLADPSFAALSNSNALMNAYAAGGSMASLSAAPAGGSSWNNSLAAYDGSAMAALIRQGQLGSSHLLPTGLGDPFLNMHGSSVGALSLMGGFGGGGAASLAANLSGSGSGSSLGAFGGAHSADVLRLRLLDESLRFSGSAPAADGGLAAARASLTFNQQQNQLFAAARSATAGNRPWGAEGSETILRDIVGLGGRDSSSLPDVVSAQSAISSSPASALTASSDTRVDNNRKRQYGEVDGGGEGRQRQKGSKSD